MAVETNARIEFSVSSVEEWEKVNPKLHQGEPVFAKKPSGKYILKVGAPGGSTYKNAVVVWDQDDAETKMENTQTAAAEALASKNAAAVSAANAKTSETAAAASKSAAATSAANAKTSETNAAASKTAAANSASTASAKATAAGNSASAAAASEKNAASSASAAATSESNALKSASVAATSATNAKTSETRAASSASAAKTSETAAAASKSAAATSEANAKTSETNAASSKTSAANSASTASTKATSAGNSASAAAASEKNASASASAAKASENAAFASKSAAATSASNAKTSEANAANSAKAAKQSEENAKRWDPTQYVQSVAESNGKVTVTKGGGESTTFNAGLNILARNKAYAVGDIAYSPNLPSYLYLECTTEGTTGATEPDMSTISGAMVDDGTAKFSVKTVCAKEYVDSKSDNEAKKWKNAYNSLRKRSYPIEFDEDELTLLASDFPPNKSPLKLSQPYTGFDGLYLIYGESNSVTSEYISTKQIQERMNFGKGYWLLGNGVGSMFTRASVLGTTPTSIVLNFNSQTFWRVYGVKFKKIT